MHTERFRHLRKDALSGILDKDAVSGVWRKIVRGQLRNLDIKDLFDHYDFNFNIEERTTAIRNDILNGTYKPVAPLIYRIEKKYGVCRHMVIPSPTDALILQVLVESVAEQIIAKQPSENAFYSRDKHNVKTPHEGMEYGVPFKEQWKQLQKKIYKFTEDKELLVVTDLANYYDSISLPELRKVFLSHVKTNEVIVDLLFQIIEGISWTPDYLPYSGKGLPTAHIEAIRLLAHSFLFEIDEVLKKRTKESFARWMDDITIGVDSRKEAVSIISAISDMLKSRGLALNLSKTAILDTKAAEHDFLISRPCRIRFQRRPTEVPANSADRCQRTPGITARRLNLSTFRNSISASNTLFSPYSAGFDKAKKAAFAALAACATMARISQRML